MKKQENLMTKQRQKDMPLRNTRKPRPSIYSSIYCLKTDSFRADSACRASTAEALTVACWTACATSFPCTRTTD